MRIKENFTDGCELYTAEMKKRVADVFCGVSKVSELKDILSEIKKNSCELRKVFLSEEEIKARNAAKESLDGRMQDAVTCITQNLEAYQQYNWRKLSDKGEKDDE
jgi:hypothetical protein